MNAVKNLKISHKLTLLVSIMMVFLLLTVSVAITKMDQIGKLLEGVVQTELPVVQAMTQITEKQLQQEVMLERALRLASVITNSDNMSQINKVQETYLHYGNYLHKQIKLISGFLRPENVHLDDKESLIVLRTTLERLEKFEQEHKRFDQTAQEVFNFINQNNLQQAFRVATVALAQSVVLENEAIDITKSFESITEGTSNKALKVEIESLNWLVMLLIMALFLGTVVSIILGRYIVRPLKEMVSVVNHVATEASLDSRIQYQSNDEVGEVSKAFNQLLSNFQRAVKETNSVVGAIAKGDFHQRVTSELKGDLATLKQGVNGSAESVKFMMDELAKVMQALHDGKFDVKMDSRVPKTFSAQVETALQTINNVISDINNVMQAMSQGEFQHRVGANANGQLAIMKQNINNSMAALESAINDITLIVVAQSNGDLTQTITNEYAGQLGVVKDAMNKSVASLNEIVSVVIDAANTVTTGAGEVALGAMDLSQRVQEQAAAVEQSSATMEEFSAAVQNNAKNSSEEAEVEHQVETKAQQAAEVMKQTIVAMSAIQESSHKISDIVSLIDGIAFQTNLLALNAAVEAARAGDHGRGFAVVAGEVRALAQKSAEAAKDIKTLISESVTRIDQGTQLATESGEAINEIATAIEHVSHMSEQISQASSEQAEGVRQLQMALTQIDQVTQQNAALVEETSSAAESMREQAGVLSERMRFFKTTKSGSNEGQVRMSKPVQLSAPVKTKAAMLPGSLRPIML